MLGPVSVPTSSLVSTIRNLPAAISFFGRIQNETRLDSLSLRLLKLDKFWFWIDNFLFSL